MIYPGKDWILISRPDQEKETINQERKFQSLKNYHKPETNLVVVKLKPNCYVQLQIQDKSKITKLNISIKIDKPLMLPNTAELPPQFCPVPF